MELGLGDKQSVMGAVSLDGAVRGKTAGSVCSVAGEAGMAVSCLAGLF